MTAQDVSRMLQCGQKSITFLINNGGYTMEVKIHDGPYNVIKNWKTGTTLGMGWWMHSTMVKESVGQQSSACVLNNAHKSQVWLS